MHWYLFEGDLKDSKTKASAEREIKPAGRNSPQWMSANGTYGLAAGPNDAYYLPSVKFSNNGNNSWKILFRLKPLDKGNIISVQFGPNFDAVINLANEGDDFILTLGSPKETVSKIYTLPEEDGFITVAINFSVQPEVLSASLSIAETTAEPVDLGVKLDKEFKIALGLGNTQGNAAPQSAPQSAAPSPALTAIWDELAVVSENIKKTDAVEEELLEIAGQPEVASDDPEPLA